LHCRRFTFARTNELETESGFEFENQQRAALRYGRFLVDFLVGEGAKRALPPRRKHVGDVLLLAFMGSMAVSCS
jgi:hypothetical protein